MVFLLVSNVWCLILFQMKGTCATRLYDKGLPEQLIQETTGHRSVDGVRCLE